VSDLSFRERAAIAIYSARSSGGVLDPTEECVNAADRLAKAACEAWGHDMADGRTRCKRCGLRFSPNPKPLPFPIDDWPPGERT